MISRSTPGTPVTWSIGARGQTPDEYPARIVDRPRISQDQRGRLVEVVNVIALRTNLEGEQYLSSRLVVTQFLSDRTQRVAALDGTADQPKTIRDLIAEQASALSEFQAKQGAAMTVAELAPASLVD